MKVAIDLDGVCYEFQRTYRYMIREYRGVDMPPVCDFWVQWDSQKQYGKPSDHQWMWTEGVKLGLFRYGHMTTGARRGLQALDEMGHTLMVVTSRPFSAHEDTQAWCDLFFKDIDATLHMVARPEEKVEIDWDIIVDDKPENVRDAMWAGRKAVLFSQPWNRSFLWWQYGARRASDWNDVVRIIEEEAGDGIQREGTERDHINLRGDAIRMHQGRRQQTQGWGES